MDAEAKAKKPRKKREPKPLIEVTEGWYIPAGRPHEAITPPPRWVLAIGNGYCYYSRGDTTHFECSLQTMRKWITRYKARRPVAR